MNLLPWVESRILSFLNQATLSDFDLIKDDPTDGPGPSVGSSAADKILFARQQLPARRFRSIEQVLDIPGIGPDKIKDLSYSLGIPADQHFIELLNAHLLPENWHLNPFSIVYKDDAHFFQVAHNIGSLTEVVSEEVERIVLERTKDQLSAFLAGELVDRSPIEATDESHHASLRLATWFYRFDADNWFGFQEMWEACDRYLNYYPEWQFRLETFFFKGFPNSGVLTDHICPRDLPVVVNFGEKRITIWTSGLAD